MRGRLVVDTNVLIGAALTSGGPNREVIRRCFEDKAIPLMGNALYREYEDVFGREEVIAKSPLSKKDIGILFDSFMSICQWTPIYYLWRPNLRDEGDNHLIELAIAGNANVIVTNNVKDFRNSELIFEDISILTPFEWLKEKQS